MAREIVSDKLFFYEMLRIHVAQRLTTERVCGAFRNGKNGVMR